MEFEPGFAVQLNNDFRILPPASVARAVDAVGADRLRDRAVAAARPFRLGRSPAGGMRALVRGTGRSCGARWRERYRGPESDGIPLFAHRSLSCCDERPGTW